MKNENITSSIEEITPAIAQSWLDNSNTENRSYSQAIIESYADTMKSGNWLVNGEAITFDNKGNLLNGHHRLKAVMAWACTIKSFVVRGIEPKAFSTFDCGRNRTFGQLVSMQGCENGNNVAASVKAYLTLHKGMVTSFNGAATGLSTKDIHETNKSLVDFFIRNKSYFCDIVSKAMAITGKARLLKTSFVSGSIAYLSRDCGYDEDTVYEFFKQLCSLDTSENKTINILRKRLASERNDKAKSFMRQVHEMLTIKCWNAFVTGKEVKVFNWHKETEGFAKYLKKNEI